MPVKIIAKSTRESGREKNQQKYPWKTQNARENPPKYARENAFCAREKKSKNPVFAREKWPVRREKSEKNEKKWAWKSEGAREKMQKNVKNRFSRPLSFSRPKKNTLDFLRSMLENSIS